MCKGEIFVGCILYVAIYESYGGGYLQHASFPASSRAPIDDRVGKLASLRQCTTAIAGTVVHWEASLSYRYPPPYFL